MHIKTRESQSGFAAVIVVLVVVLFVVGAGATYLRINNNNKDSSAKNTSQVSNPSDAVPLDDSSAQIEPVASQQTEVAPQQPEPQAPVPAPQVSGATTFSIANCIGNTTAFVSNTNGAKAYTPYPETPNTTIKRTYQYKEQITVYCSAESGSNYPAYAEIDSAYVIFSDLSPTKP